GALAELPYEAALLVGLQVSPGKLLANPVEAGVASHLQATAPLRGVDLLLQERVDAQGVRHRVARRDVISRVMGAAVSQGGRDRDDPVPQIIPLHASEVARSAHGARDRGGEKNKDGGDDPGAPLGRALRVIHPLGASPGRGVAPARRVVIMPETGRTEGRALRSSRLVEG